MITKEFEQGMIAREQKKHLCENPYVRHTDEHEEWIRGWKLEHWRLLHNKWRKEEYARTEDDRQI